MLIRIPPAQPGRNARQGFDIRLPLDLTHREASRTLIDGPLGGKRLQFSRSRRLSWAVHLKKRPPPPRPPR
jgi:hypothetical protein